jgi:hypothetical protein
MTTTCVPGLAQDNLTVFPQLAPWPDPSCFLIINALYVWSACLLFLHFPCLLFAISEALNSALPFFMRVFFSSCAVLLASSMSFLIVLCATQDPQAITWSYAIQSIVLWAWSTYTYTVIIRILVRSSLQSDLKNSFVAFFGGLHWVVVHVVYNGLAFICLCVGALGSALLSRDRTSSSSGLAFWRVFMVGQTCLLLYAAYFLWLVLGSLIKNLVVTIEHLQKFKEMNGRGDVANEAHLRKLLPLLNLLRKVQFILVSEFLSGAAFYGASAIFLPFYWVMLYIILTGSLLPPFVCLVLVSAPQRRAQRFCCTMAYNATAKRCRWRPARSNSTEPTLPQSSKDAKKPPGEEKEAGTASTLQVVAIRVNVASYMPA